MCLGIFDIKLKRIKKGVFCMVNYYPPSNYYGFNNYSVYPNYQNPNIGNFVSRLVENEEIARASEVPLGSFGVFPKADFQEIYLKSWNKDGTTSLIKYCPTKEVNFNQENSVNNLIQKISEIEQKLDAILVQERIVVDAPIAPEVKTIKRKEVSLNDY